MKKLLSLALALVLLCGCTAAYAVREGKYTIPMEGTILQNEPDRNIKLNGRDSNGNFPDNPVIPGESPTTGLPWEGTYQPMLVQISNPSGGTGKNSPWGGMYADIVYEGVLYSYGPTRISFLFSDNMPTSVGPVRSARVGHALLREEWEAGFIFFGGPERLGNNIIEVMQEYKAYDKGVIFNLSVGSSKPWMEYMQRLTKGKHPKAPDNVDINVAGVQSLIDPAKNPTHQHPFLFVDDSPYDGPLAYTITLDWGHDEYVSRFYYVEEENLYYRYVRNDKGEFVPYASFFDSAEWNAKAENTQPMAFENLIIQRVEVEYANDSDTQPVMNNIDQGNADIFIGGRYIAGYWIRTGVDQRTVYFDSEGNELKLTRGKTMIVHMPNKNPVTFTGIE